MAHPTIIDIGTDEDAGEWLAALPYCRFEISEHTPGRLPDGDTLPGALFDPFNHDNADSPGEQSHHA
jgi:hypothetical protein